MSIPDSIEQYQNAINNFFSKLDFAIGSGLYMIPSDLVIKKDNLDNYNNNILIASDNMDFGINNINNKLAPPIIKSDDLPVSNILKNNDLITNNISIYYNYFAQNKNLIENNDLIYKDCHENKYILPLIVGGSGGYLDIFNLYNLLSCYLHYLFYHAGGLKRPEGYLSFFSKKE